MKASWRLHPRSRRLLLCVKQPTAREEEALKRSGFQSFFAASREARERGQRCIPSHALRRLGPQAQCTWCSKAASASVSTPPNRGSAYRIPVCPSQSNLSGFKICALVGTPLISRRFETHRASVWTSCARRKPSGSHDLFEYADDAFGTFGPIQTDRNNVTSTVTPVQEGF